MRIATWNVNSLKARLEKVLWWLERAAPDDQPLREPRMVSAIAGGQIRVVSLYAPNGRTVDSIYYQAKLAWYGRLGRWLDETRRPDEPLVLGGDFNVAPTDADVWDPAAFEGATHVSAPERAALAELERWGLVDVFRTLQSEPGLFSWWDYRAGNFHKRQGMRIDLVMVSAALAERATYAVIDRNARKGQAPSDHAPVIIDFAD